MTEPPKTEPPKTEPGEGPEPTATALPSAPPAAGSRSLADLEAYVAANAGRYTDEALTDTLVAAGYPADDVRLALAGAASRRPPQRVRPRAFRAILGAYVAVFALLSLGMLLNGRPAGYLMPDAEGGIQILAISLGAALVASLIWVASRRLFVILILVGVALYGLAAAMAPGTNSTLVGLAAVVLGLGGTVVLLRRPTDAGPRRQTELSLLLALPVILLLGVAGICVASGLPIPGGP